MTVNSLGAWLRDNGFNGSSSPGHRLFMPDFFGVGFDEVYYGANMVDMVGVGETFVQSNAFGDTFSIDSSGLVPGLPSICLVQHRLYTCLAQVGQALHWLREPRSSSSDGTKHKFQNPMLFALLCVSGTMLASRWRRRELAT